MSLFQKFMDFKSSNRIAICLEQYEKAVEGRLGNVVSREEYLESSEAERIAIEQTLLEQHYPRTHHFMLALASMNPTKIQSAYKVYQEWHQDALPEPLFQFKAQCLYGQKCNVDEKETLRFLVHKTSKNMHKLGRIIEMATTRIPGWASLVRIEPKEPQDQEWVYPVDKALVEVSRPPASAKFGCALLPANIEIWTLDENNDAFYGDGALQEDYFGLVREMQRPGPAPAKLRTLYFQAPIRERAVYADARRKLSILGGADLYPRPLTESPGEQATHDTWKVRVNSRHLVEVQTGHYEPIGNAEIPIKHIELVSEGTL